MPFLLIFFCGIYSSFGLPGVMYSGTITYGGLVLCWFSIIWYFIHIVVTAIMFCPIFSYDGIGNPSHVLLVCASGLYGRHMTRLVLLLQAILCGWPFLFLFLAAPWGLDWVNQYIILFCKLSLTVLWFPSSPLGSWFSFRHISFY